MNSKTEMENYILDQANNVSKLDKIVAPLRPIQQRTKNIILCLKKFKNPLHVALAIRSSSYPVVGISKKNKTVTFNSEKEFLYYLYNMPIDESVIHIQTKEIRREMLIARATNEGDLMALFALKSYARLPVEDAVVFDIGAAVADSSIYFALRGAKKVISIEPYGYNIELARKNILLNKLDNVELLQCGVSSNLGSISVDHKVDRGSQSAILNDKSGVPNLSLVTLEELVKRYNDKNMVAKIDCEGCEYEIILKTPINILSKLKAYVLEYHWGGTNLQKKFEEAGFKVSNKFMGRFYNPEIKLQYHFGMMYAWKKHN